MDIILLGFLAGLTFGGWRTGLLHRLAGLAFLVIAFIAGAYLRGPFGGLVTTFLPDVPADYSSLIGYIFVFPVVLAVLHIVSYPFIHRINPRGLTQEVDRALGAVFGFVEGVLILSAVVVILDTYFAGGGGAGSPPGLDTIRSLTASFNSSVTVQLLRSTTVPLVLAVLGPFLPSDISSLVPGGLPGMPGIPGLPGLPGVRFPAGAGGLTALSPLR
jgi:hypothetical protein